MGKFMLTNRLGELQFPKLPYHTSCETRDMSIQSVHSKKTLLAIYRLGERRALPVVSYFRNTTFADGMTISHTVNGIVSVFPRFHTADV